MLNVAVNHTNNTVIAPWIGYISTVAVGVFWGSNFVPVKSYDAGDGLFFQWVLCSAVFVVGFIVYASRGFPVFQPLAMLGGFLWCFGNLMSVPVINMIGLSLGMLIWGTTSLVVGWGTGTFGLFWLKRNIVHTPWMNYLGAALAVLSTIIFGFIKSKVGPKQEEFDSTPTTVTSAEEIDYESRQKLINSEELKSPTDENKNVFAELTKNMSLNFKRLLGISLSVISGVFYGSNFTPPQYIMDHCTNDCSQDGLDYVYSHFCGIYLSSTFFFLLYCAILTFLKRKIFMPRQIVLPGFVSGLMWASAQTLSFVSISSLSMAVSFPMITTFPGLIASLWGILLFKEISGITNYMLYLTAFILVISAALLVAFSRG